MFNRDIYIKRRDELRKKVKNGIAIFIGNNEAPMNYPANPYRFRQDSDFLYFFGIDLPGLAGLVDFETGEDRIFGDDYSIDDIIWMGPQPSLKEIAERCGIRNTASFSDLEDRVGKAIDKKRKIHFLPPYRGETMMLLGGLIREDLYQMKNHASVDLIKAVVALRSVKEDVEIEEIERAVGIAYEMHVTAMRMCKPGIREQDIFGMVEGIALAKGAGTSFPVILSMDGQTLHNHSHGNTLAEGRMMLMDAGAETCMHYASDITRTTPVGGKFSSRQKEVYEIVLNANMKAIKAAQPGRSNRDIHILACQGIAEGLKDIGIIRGDINEVVTRGAHALFMPHGIGHMMGLDVHDMEALGEEYVGYNENISRSDQFGMAYLRFALPYSPGHVFTIEPGCYFIPELINLWKKEKRYTEYINYRKVDDYISFGGIRIEDNILITSDGNKVLGPPIPKTVNEVESICYDSV